MAVVGNVQQTVKDTAYVIVELVSRVARRQGVSFPPEEALQDVMVAVMRALHTTVGTHEVSALSEHRYLAIGSPGHSGSAMRTPLQVSPRRSCCVMTLVNATGSATFGHNVCGRMKYSCRQHVLLRSDHCRKDRRQRQGLQC